MQEVMLTIGWADLKSFLSVGYILFVIVTIAVIIHDKREPVKALSWIIVISLLPVVGFVFYIVFGRNHRKQKLFNRKELHDLEQIDALSRQQIYEINHPSLLHKSEISDHRDTITLLLNSNKALLTVHNRVRVLNDGAETFDEIRRALRQARESIHMEYYIIEDDELGREIADILIAKAAEGVEVRLIYDDVGSWGLGRKYLGRLRRAGVEVRCFMPVVFPWLTSHVNYRNHRKILVVDGRIGFTGGINIAQRYVTGTKLGPWRDTHLRLEGEAVGMLQIVFITDWFFVTKKLLADYDKYLPKTHVRDETMIQIVTSGPDSDWASIMQAFFSAISHAQHHIYISSPYFLPNEAILTAVKVASLSGIDVRIIEQNPDRCLELAAVLPDTCIIQGDASDERVLNNEGIEDCDVLVTLTGLDEINMIVSLYGNSCGVPQIITKLGRVESGRLLEQVSLGSVISPKELCCDSIIRYVRAMKNQTGAAVAVHAIADG